MGFNLFSALTAYSKAKIKNDAKRREAEDQEWRRSMAQQNLDLSRNADSRAQANSEYERSSRDRAFEYGKGRDQSADAARDDAVNRQQQQFELGERKDARDFDYRKSKDAELMDLEWSKLDQQEKQRQALLAARGLGKPSGAGGPSTTEANKVYELAAKAVENDPDVVAIDSEIKSVQGAMQRMEIMPNIPSNGNEAEHKSLKARLDQLTARSGELKADRQRQYLSAARAKLEQSAPWMTDYFGGVIDKPLQAKSAALQQEADLKAKQQRERAAAEAAAAEAAPRLAGDAARRKLIEDDAASKSADFISMGGNPPVRFNSTQQRPDPTALLQFGGAPIPSPLSLLNRPAAAAPVPQAPPTTPQEAIAQPPKQVVADQVRGLMARYEELKARMPAKQAFLQVLGAAKNNPNINRAAAEMFNQIAQDGM